MNCVDEKKKKQREFIEKALKEYLESGKEIKRCTPAWADGASKQFAVRKTRNKSVRGKYK